MSRVVTGFVLALLLVGSALAAPYHHGSCVQRKPGVTTTVRTPLPHTYLDVNGLPDNWDWRNVNGTNFTTVPRNQHLPVYCGSCWNINAMSALGDRIYIMNDAQWTEPLPSPQVLLNCATSAGTCHGGDPTAAYEYVLKNGVPDETCQPYEAKDNACTPENICRNCNPSKCWAQQTYTKYQISEHGQVAGEQKMMAEIFARGPIACSMCVTQAFESYSGGVFKDNTGSQCANHEISLVGWGIDSGSKYWIGRNSWGKYWGESGFFRIEKGVNSLGIESSCDWAVPKRS